MSTCYVSGRYDGEFTEDGLDEGQAFRNHYESTKFEAELLVRKAMADGLPATIYRPGIVVGDSRPGRRRSTTAPTSWPHSCAGKVSMAVVPAGRRRRRRAGLPGAARLRRRRDGPARPRWTALSAAPTPSPIPNPPTVRELVDDVRRAPRQARGLGAVAAGPARALVGAVPGMERLLGLPAEALDYFASPTTYSTAKTTATWQGTGVSCPPFTSYAGRLLDFMTDPPRGRLPAMA